MTCAVANILREKWYATTIRLDANSSEALRLQAMRLRETKEYQEALAAYIDHRSLCKECQKDWDHMTPAFEDKGMDVSVIYAKHVKQPVTADDYTDH